jgi:hypothetical protein
MKAKITALTLALLSSYASADLQELGDDLLSAEVGQAFINLDSFIDPVDTNTRFSRLSFGEDIKLNLNADQVIFNNNGTVADIALNNFALGHIDTSTGTFVPFEITNPFFEWAIEDDGTGKQNLVGFRLGFGEAKGSLSADITSLSGNIDINFTDGTNTYAGDLLDASGNTTTNQANQLGISGSSCAQLSGNETCYNLANFKSFSIADSDGSSTSDFILSVQNKNFTWKWGSGSTVNTSYDTTKGFFINMPTDMTINLGDSTTGTARLPTEFIDRGIGRW